MIFRPACTVTVQLVNTCAAKMAQFLKERVPESVEEMVTLPEQYMEPHGGIITGREDYKNLPEAENGTKIRPKG